MLDVSQAAMQLWLKMGWYKHKSKDRKKTKGKIRKTSSVKLVKADFLSLLWKYRRPPHISLTQGSSHYLTPPIERPFSGSVGLLKHIQCPAIPDLLCACADFHFILQQAEGPLEEDPAKSPRSGHNNEAHLDKITYPSHCLHYQVLTVIFLRFYNSPPTVVLCYFHCFLFKIIPVDVPFTNICNTFFKITDKLNYKNEMYFGNYKNVTKWTSFDFQELGRQWKHNTLTRLWKRWRK